MHISVMLKESVDSLNLKEDSVVVDATLGYAGHSSSILKRIKRGFLYSFDQDGEVIEYSTKCLRSIGTNFTIFNTNFVNMKKTLNEENVFEVDAILFDLGVSSIQLDNEERGFSYHKEARLDMRMDKRQKLDAYYVINNYDKDALIKIFKDYGEAKFASNIAKNIVKERETKNIETTIELVEIIKKSVPLKFRINKHPARVIFQALRIEVNKELDVTSKALDEAFSLLKVGGRISVITFHSLEDRLVKNKFKEKTYIDLKVKGLPNVSEDLLPDFRLVYTKAIKPTSKELEENKRSRSAILRVIERVK